VNACEYVFGSTDARMCLRSCNLANTASNASQYSHVRPLWLHLIFRQRLINGTIFGKMLLDMKCVFWFSLQLSFQTILILKRIKRDNVVKVKTSSCKVATRYSCRIFRKREISRQIFEKFQISNLMKFRRVGTQLFHADRQTDRQTGRI
jgi:hypothetical protein